MKDPSALSSINVNKYFPQPRSIRIKGGGRRWKEEGKRKKKNQLVESFAQKGKGVVGEEEGMEVGKIGLSSWVSNEACFLCFKGRGKDAVLRFILCGI